nr:hypothetical protein HK105_005413 [Polyrhizophydium stewartii]
MCDGDQLVQRDNIAYSLGVLLCLSVQNLAKNAEQLIRSHSPGRVALAVASLCQALHTSLFLVQNSLRWISSCMWLSSGNDVLYYIFQILATAVLVERGTVLLPFPVGHVLRVAFTVAIIVGTAMNIYSSAIKTVLVSDLGWCVVSYDRNWNTRAKIVYVGIYLLVQRDKIAYALGVFMCLSVQNCFDNLAMLARRPTLARALQLTASVCHTIDNGVFILQNSLRWLPSCDGLSAVGDMSFYVFQVLSTGILIFRGTALLPASVVTAARVVLGATGFVAFALNVVNVFSGEASGNRVRLRQFIAGFAAKIALAVVVYLATTVLSLVGFWGDYFFVQFAIQDYARGAWPSVPAAGRQVAVRPCERVG